MGFKRAVAGKGEGLTLACIEVHADSRGHLLPDPRHDAVRAVIIAVAEDNEDVPDGQYFTRVLLCDEHDERGEHQQPAGEEVECPGVGGGGSDGTASGNGTAAGSGGGGGGAFKDRFSKDGLSAGTQLERFSSETALLDAFVDAVRCLDPDILLGYEIQRGSLGYIMERAAAAYDEPNFLQKLSRLPGDVMQGNKSRKEGPGANDQYGWQHASGLHVAGRMVLNVWRLMRSGACILDTITMDLFIDF